MKKLIYTALFTLVFAVSTPAAYAVHLPDNVRFTDIHGTVQFPQGKWGVIRQTFQLHISQNSSALSQLDIEIPRGLTVENEFSVSDQFGRVIQANTSVTEHKITINFTQAVVPGTILTIEMNRVNRIGISNGWLYRVSAKFVGSNTDIPIGIARFRAFI